MVVQNLSKLHTETKYKTVLNTPIDTRYSSNVLGLNAPFTSDEFKAVLKCLKSNKATGIDRISNEMIKNSPENIHDMLLKFINICLKNSMVSGNICFELITPLFKDGLLDDPNNYRGLCISSALLK